MSGSDLGRPVDAAVPRESRHEWLFKRNCSLSPGQLAMVLAVPSLVSLVIAAGWSMLGATPILVFALLEVTAIVIAFFVHGRHAADYERIVLAGEALTVERCAGSRTDRFEAARGMARVQMPQGPRDLVRITAGAQAVEVGRHATAPVRRSLAQELRGALRAPSFEFGASGGRAA